MSQNKLRPGNSQQSESEVNSEQSENGRRPSGPPLVPIACRVCDRVFFDNVSLVLHFECHVKDGYRLCGKDLASLKNGKQPSPRWSPYSHASSAGMNESHHMALPKMNDYFRPRSLPANRMPTDGNHLYIPGKNLMSLVSPSFNPQSDVSQPIHNSSMSRYGVISSSTYSVMSSQLRSRNSASGSTMTPNLQLREQNEDQLDFPDYKDAPSVNPKNATNK